MQVFSVEICLCLHLWEQEKGQYRKMPLRTKSIWQRDCSHKIHYSLSQAASLPVMPSLEQIQITHELTLEVFKLTQQRFVKSVFLYLLEVMVVDLLCYPALVAHCLRFIIKVDLSVYVCWFRQTIDACFDYSEMATNSDLYW